MAWQQTPFTIPLLLAAASSLFIAAVAWRHRGRTGARSLAALMVGSTWWSVFYAVSLAHTDLAVKLLAAKAMYVGVGVVPVAWLVFAAEYTGRLQWLTRRRVGLLFVIPTVSVLLVWTNEFHGLVWASVETVTQSGIVVMGVTYGGWFWVHAAYLYLLLAVGTALVLRMVVGSEDVYRGQAIALVVAVLIPWGANALYLAGITGIWDPTNVGIVFSGAVLTVAIFRHQLLDFVPAAREVAREEIIDSMTEAVIVVDRRDLVVDLNPAAETVVGEPVGTAIGRPLGELFPGVAELSGGDDSDGPVHAEVTRPVDGVDHTFDVRIAPLRRGYGTITGRLITLRDVSDRIERERRIEQQRQLLTVVNRVLRHDIRNDMNLVLALADELQHTYPDDAVVDRITQKGNDILDLSERARQLEQLLRSDADQRTVVDVSGVVARKVDAVAQAYPAAELTLERPAYADVYANDLIDSAIGNLIENAIEHNDRPEPRVDVTVSPDDGEGVTVEIADDGPGMPPRERQVIETGTETALDHSSGLGLWLAYWIVTESGGEIGFSQNEPRGTVITVRLESAGADPG